MLQKYFVQANIFLPEIKKDIEIDTTIGPVVPTSW